MHVSLQKFDSVASILFRAVDLWLLPPFACVPGYGHYPAVLSQEGTLMVRVTFSHTEDTLTGCGGVLVQWRGSVRSAFSTALLAASCACDTQSR